MSILDILFPKFCLGCHRLGTYICPQCEKKLAYIQRDICIYCQRPSYLGYTHLFCRQKNGVDGCLSLFHYNNFMKKIIKSVKYRFATKILTELFTIIRPQQLIKLNIYKDLSPTLVPIPLHPTRLKERGFNQASILCDYFQSYTCYLTEELLQRHKYTHAQAQLKQLQERYHNMHNAFSVKESTHIKDKNIIVVDDVLTTGATTKEAVTVLKKSGAAQVYVLTLVRG